MAEMAFILEGIGFEVSILDYAFQGVGTENVRTDPGIFYYHVGFDCH